MDDHNVPWTPTSMPRPAGLRPSDFTPHPSSPYMTGPNDSIASPPAPLSSPWRAPSQPQGPTKPAGHRTNAGCLIGGGLGAVALIALIFFILLPALSGGTHARPAAVATATTATSYAATITPVPGATVTPTVGPGTPTATPVIVYLTSVPGKPSAAPTLKPNATATAYPTYTTPPAPTATATAIPIKTVVDNLDDWSVSIAHDPDLAINTGGGPVLWGDNGAAYRQSIANDSITWNFTNLRSAQFVCYFQAADMPAPTHQAFTISSDGQNWQAAAAVIAGPYTSTLPGQWTKYVYTVSPNGANYIKMIWQEQDANGSPECGQATFTYQS